MKKDKNTSSFTAIGSSSLLVVFLVLCLATFAILSLSSAKSDYSFTERLAEHKTNYYTASSHAENVVSDIDRLLEDTYKSRVMTQAEYLDALNPVLLTHEAVPLSYSADSGSPVISFNITIDERQALFVELEVTDPSKSPNYYEIKTWQVRPSNAWESDDTLNLMPIS